MTTPTDAYALIDRFLRNNLGDDDYAEYSAALDAVCQPQAVWEPLTDAQIKELIEEGVFFGNCKEIVRAIETAHGIGIKGGQS